MNDAQLDMACVRIMHLEVEQEIFLTEGEVKYRDSVTGQPLRAELVRAARRKELEYFVAKGVWRKAPRAEALRRQGKPPITVKWIDVNKGDDDCPNYRSRLVAREIRRPGEDSIFAPTPPLESLRTIISLTATDLEGDVPHDRNPISEERTQIQVLDISRAYFNAATDDSHPTYVELPDEDSDKAKGLCGHLQVHMYGTKRAADGWHTEYSDFLTDTLGFVRGGASACVFRHAKKHLKTSVYGDDFTSCGPKSSLEWFTAEMRKRYELTEVCRLGPGPNDHKEGRILNRIIRWTTDGLEYEADPRQVEKLIRELKLEGCNPLGTPGAKATAEHISGDQKLDESRCKPFRAVAARANYLAADRPECQFSSKEICRWMATPTDLSVSALKRLGRFLEGRRRLIYHYPWQSAKIVDVYSDTDWAGCSRTRKSTSGGCLMLGRHLIKSWSSTQANISLSSGEAEYYGVVKAAGIGMGYQALLKDVGVAIPLRVWTDSTATMGICARQGLGKLRHIDTQCLWVQQRVRDQTFELRKVKGTENPADLFTKHLTSASMVESLLGLFGCHYRGGRAVGAPSLRASAGTTAGEALLQVAAEHSLTRDGADFPAVLWEGEVVPEAMSYKYLEELPHQVQNGHTVFPRAVAAPARGDEDLEPVGELEVRGVLLGKESAKGHGSFR